MTPTFIDSGITPNHPNSFGPIGEIDALTFHHSAGPRAPTKLKAQQLHRAFQAQHIRQGWGDIGYHFSMDDLGRIYRLRPHTRKGAHTGGHNTGNIGFMVHGNYDHDKLTGAQKTSLKWMFRGGFKQLFGETESGLHIVRGHQEWPGPTNTTACPGKNLMRHIRYLRNTETW